MILSAPGHDWGSTARSIPADATGTLAAVPAPRPNMQGAVGIAVIPIHGTLVRSAAWGWRRLRAHELPDIGAMLDAALADPSVTGILLDIDSPGRGIGSFELAAACARPPRETHLGRGQRRAFRRPTPSHRLPNVPVVTEPVVSARSA